MPGGTAGERVPAAAPRPLWTLLVPDQWVDGIDEIDCPALSRRGIRCLLVDIDNTLIPWTREGIDERARRFIERARRSGLRVAIVSNARARRRRAIADELGVPVSGRGVKPMRRGFWQSARELGCRPDQSAVVGDQLWTDVLGGHRAGMYAILVDPIDEREHLFTRWVFRRLERALLRWMGRRGLVDEARLARRFAPRGRTSPT